MVRAPAPASGGASWGPRLHVRQRGRHNRAAYFGLLVPCLRSFVIGSSAIFDVFRYRTGKRKRPQRTAEAVYCVPEPRPVWPDL